MTWQPIETAPKDGSPILLYGTYQWEDYKNYQEGGIFVGYLYSSKSSEYYEEQDDVEEYWRLVNANPYIDKAQPSHWMPLPEVPE